MIGYMIVVDDDVEPRYFCLTNYHKPQWSFGTNFARKFSSVEDAEIFMDNAEHFGVWDEVGGAQALRIVKWEPHDGQ